MTSIPAGPPRATILMTARERHGLTERAIASIVAGTRPPYRFVYASGATPAALMVRLRERAIGWGLAIADVDARLFPHQLRRQLIGVVDTEYVAFVDNDVIVGEGWLDALVACADATGAAVVGARCLVGGDERKPGLIAAGGRLDWIETPAGRKVRETPIDPSPDPGTRTPVDYVDFRCMLVRTSVARDGALFDPAIACVHEQIDLATTLRERGLRAWSEPAACVTYLGRGLWNVEDLPYLRWRFSRDAAEASIAAFCRKWGVVDDDESFHGVRSFVRFHKSRVDPLREGVAGQARLERPMRASELPQTREALVDLARASGWKEGDVAVLRKQHDVAAILAEGGYRACGRPFLAHLVGTGGVLLRYGFTPDIVYAGLLHAAYSHCPELPAGQRSSLETVRGALGGESRLERLVRAYTRLRDRPGDLVARLRAADAIPLIDADLVAIATANEIDMALSGEHRDSSRATRADEAARAVVRRLCATLGCPGLSATLDAAAALDAAPGVVVSAPQASYRIVEGKRVPMASRGFAAFDRR